MTTIHVIVARAGHDDSYVWLVAAVRAETNARARLQGLRAAEDYGDDPHGSTYYDIHTVELED